MSPAEFTGLVASVASLADTCRAKGIDVVKVSVDGTIKLRMGTAPAKPKVAMSDAEREEADKVDAHEARRRRYEKQFGRKVGDAELDGLPE
jgi:hypothetical protein